MKAVDVVSQLWNRLPLFTDKFTDDITISSITTVGTTATVQTSSDHNLEVGRYINLENVFVPVEIQSVVDDAPASNSWTITTVTDHDITRHINQRIAVTARITGSLDETFTVLPNPANRRTFQIQKGTGTPVAGDFLQQQLTNAYEGLHEIVTVPTTTSFTITLPEALPSPNFIGSPLKAIHRITAAVDYDTAKRAYTAQSSNDDCWLFVVMNDTAPNKDRQTGDQDTSAARGRLQEYYHTLIEAFSIYVFVPNKGANLQDVGGVIARDTAIDQRRPIFQSVLGVQFSPGLGCPGQFTTSYNGDGFWEYTGAYYVHVFQFQEVATITNDDVATTTDHRAFRDISFTIDNLGIQETDTDLTANVDLDTDPLS